MMQHFNYSLKDLDNMMPWEREIYVVMLTNYLREEAERSRRQGN